MAPFEQHQEFLRVLYPLRDDSIDELRIEKRSGQKGNKNYKHADRDFFGRDSDYSDEYLVAAATPATSTPAPTTPTSLIAPLSPTTQAPPSLIPLLTTTPLASSSMPTTTQRSLSTWTTASSNQGSKALDPSTSDYTMSTSTPSLVVSSTQLIQTASSATAALDQTTAATTSTLAPVTTDVGSHSLSPTAQHVLISAATIGAIILIGTIVYCVLRFLRIDIMGQFRRFSRRGRGSWRPGSYCGTEYYAPPFATLNDEKLIPSIRKPYAPIVIEPVPMAVLPSTQELSRADAERQKLVREALLSKLEDTALYHETLQSGPQPQPARQPSIAYTELSSLSSGFGDAKIDIPESGPTKPNSQRKSRASRASQKDINYSRFSWSSSPTTLGRGRGNRDTIYTSTTTHTTLTTSSEESGPRFRTVNSWVSHQAKRVQRQKDHDREIDSMPALPAQAHAKRAHHQRLQSEITDPGFKYHPGDEVRLASGNRVPSAILDKII